ncbi:MAG: hypothetical protein AAGD43_01835 [Pseudomonadota bacterium]
MKTTDLRILVIDDEAEYVARLTKSAEAYENVTISTSFDLGQITEILSLNNPNCILLDYNLGGPHEVVDAIRSIRAGNSRVPVILISKSDCGEILQNARVFDALSELDVSVFLQKGAPSSVFHYWIQTIEFSVHNARFKSTKSLQTHLAQLRHEVRSRLSRVRDNVYQLRAEIDERFPEKQTALKLESLFDTIAQDISVLEEFSQAKGQKDEQSIVEPDVIYEVLQNFDQFDGEMVGYRSRSLGSVQRKVTSLFLHQLNRVEHLSQPQLLFLHRAYPHLKNFFSEVDRRFIEYALANTSLDG